LALETPQKLAKHCHGISATGAQARQSRERELRLGERQRLGMESQPAVPADRRPLELLRLDLGEQVEVVEQVVQAGGAELAERLLGAPIRP
jgi:hypothetical protein